MEVQVRKLLFSVEDQEGQCVKGVLVRFYVGNKVRTEATTTCERPLEFSIDAKVEIVDVEIFFGEIREWLKVPMDSGLYTHKINVQHSKDTQSPIGNPQVIAAVITLVGVLVVGYWQFIYKRGKTPPPPPPPQSVQLRIGVRDLNDQHPIANAQVEIEDGAHRPSELTDKDGYTNAFILETGGSSTVTVIVTAPGFELTKSNLDRPTKDEIATIVVKRLADVATRDLPVAPTKDHPAAAPRKNHPDSGNFTLAGTWEIQAPDDPANAAIKDGSFTFSPRQADDSVSVTAHFVIDTIKVALDGTCGVQGRIVHMKFRANTDPAVDTWNGEGDFRFESQSTLTGRLRSKRGDDIPFVLVKHGSGSADRSQLESPMTVWTDPKNGLMWTGRDSGKFENWATAEYYCSTAIGGYKDWRLPTIDELANIYDSNSPHQFTYRNPPCAPSCAKDGDEDVSYIKGGIKLESCCAWSKDKDGSLAKYYRFQLDPPDGNRTNAVRVGMRALMRALCVRSR